jgi:antitoxin MazE
MAYLHVDTYNNQIGIAQISQEFPMPTTVTKAEQTVQEWGNGLAVRLTAPVARAAHLARGTPVTLEVVEGGIFVRIAGKPKLSLAQKLKSFDPDKHGGEAMASGRAGAEKF